MRLLGLNLRSTMTAAIVALALLTILTAGALVGLTTIIHTAGRQATAAVETVRLTEAMQRNMLLHDRLQHDDVAREQVAHALRDRMREVRPQATTPEQRGVLAAVDRTVGGYLAMDANAPPAETTKRHGDATAAIALLRAGALADVEEASGRVHTLDDLADVIGAIAATVVTLTAASLVWWLNARALRPIFELAGTMRRFGRGDMEARAVEEGPAELSEMARRFNEMASAITRQRQDRQAFIAGVVHDLRTPLSVLRMSSDVATTTGAELSPERLAKVFGTVGRQVTRLERMAGDLLESVTIEAGKFTLRGEELDAREIATQAVELYAAASAKHTIALDMPEHALLMTCDRMRLEQVISNLLSNAIKYSPEGGRISLQLTERAGDVVFVVHDEGVGMSEVDASMAFEPFRRSAGMRDQVPGSGLGLFIVRRLVEAHGGRIELRTAPGSGSTFEVRIPVRMRSADDEESHGVLHAPHEEEARARASHASSGRGTRPERHH